MNKLERHELIKNSIKIKAFMHESMLYVNIFSIIKPYAFCCEERLLMRHLVSLTDYPVATRLTLDKKEINVMTIRHITVDAGNKCRVIFHDGSTIEGDALDYDSVSPTLEELEKMIRDSIENF